MSQKLDIFGRPWQPQPAPTFPDGLGVNTKCTVPPAGWKCSRIAGHAGPCAATQTANGPGAELTEAVVLEAGFHKEPQNDFPPFQQYYKDGIAISRQNELYWVVDALADGGVDVEFKTLGQLDLFFIACGKPSLIN